MGIQENPAGGALEGEVEVGILCHSDGLEEGEVFCGERVAVGQVLIPV